MRGKNSIVIVHEEKLVMGETNNELERIFNSYRPSHFMLVERQQFWNFRLRQISHIILSRYILGNRGIGGGVRENNANRFRLRING